jgi:NAD(P)-dependent dehydrogenase (short-subunit alcohol dehydrogenase family)
MPISVKDKVVVVTGGAGVLGGAIARRLAKEGARVVVADIADGSAFAAEISQGAGEAIYARTDVGDEASTMAMAEAALSRFGRIDVLVNNAGDTSPRPFDELTYEEWRRRMRVNLDGAFLATKAVVPAMTAQKKGKIVNIGSDTVWMGTPGFVHYVASKGGLLAMTRALAHELGPRGITTCFVTPTLLDTPVTRQQFQQGHFDYVLGHTPLGRLETPEDVTGLLVFLCSDEAEWINGAAINIGGGISMH